MVGGSESVVLISSAGSCAGSSNVVDAVSVGAITDTLAGLALPALPGALTDGASVERKACYNSTADADATTGLLHRRRPRAPGQQRKDPRLQRRLGRPRGPQSAKLRLRRRNQNLPVIVLNALLSTMLKGLNPQIRDYT